MRILTINDCQTKYSGAKLWVKQYFLLCLPVYPSQQEDGWRRISIHTWGLRHEQCRGTTIYVISHSIWVMTPTHSVALSFKSICNIESSIIELFFYHRNKGHLSVCEGTHPGSGATPHSSSDNYSYIRWFTRRDTRCLSEESPDKFPRLSRLSRPSRWVIWQPFMAAY